jgi:hypothetical protein
VARQAADLRGSFPSAEDFLRAQEAARANVERVAQSFLTRLQNALIDQDPEVARSNPQDRTFLHFCVLRGDEDALVLYRRLADQGRIAVTLANGHDLQTPFKITPEQGAIHMPEAPPAEPPHQVNGV